MKAKKRLRRAAMSGVIATGLSLPLLFAGAAPAEAVTRRITYNGACGGPAYITVASSINGNGGHRNIRKYARSPRRDMDSVFMETDVKGYIEFGRHQTTLHGGWNNIPRGYGSLTIYQFTRADEEC